MLNAYGDHGCWEEVFIYGHQDLEHAKYPNCTPFFSTEFYRFYGAPDKRLMVKELAAYVRFLAIEYMSAIENVVFRDQRPITVLIHTACAEHLWALSLSLKHERRVATCIVMLMYMPPSDQSEAAYSLESALYSMALRSLLALDFVRIYCSDAETSEYFSQSLSLRARLPLHPVMGMSPIRERLVSIDSHLDAGAKDKDLGRTLVYTGDAKKEKGFAALGHLIRQLESFGQSLELLVHYNPDVVEPGLDGVREELSELADMGKIVLYETFFNAQEYQKLLNSCDTLVINYSAQAYKSKSAGALWNACYFGCQILASKDNWLARELGRFGYIGQDDLPELEGFPLTLFFPPTQANHYFQTMFIDFSDWLSGQIDVLRV